MCIFSTMEIAKKAMEKQPVIGARKRRKGARDVEMIRVKDQSCFTLWEISVWAASSVGSI